MKTIMMAAALSLMLAPTAFAAVPVKADTAEKAHVASQAVKDEAVLLAKGTTFGGGYSASRCRSTFQFGCRG